MKNLDQFLDEAQSTKCPKGHRYDTKLKSCVPKKNYPYYPYGMIGRREEPKNGKNGNGNGHSNGNGNGNGNGGNGGATVAVVMEEVENEDSSTIPLII